MISRDTKETFKIVKTEINNCIPTHSIIDLEDISFKGKSVVCLSGNLTNTPQKAVGYSANAYNWLSSPARNDVTFYSLYYPTEQPLETNLSQNMALDYRRLSKKLLMSAVRKDNSALPMDEMIKNLSNITFFGHSAGGFVMDEIIDYFKVFLKRYSFSKSEIEKILSNIVFVGYSPFKFVEHPIKAIYVTPFYDTLGSSRKTIEEISANGDYDASSTEAKKLNKLAEKCTSHEELIELYKPLLQKEESIYFKTKNSIFALPNLLFDDGVIEDHNLAGVTDSQKNLPYITNAGHRTIDFLSNVFEQSVLKDRQKFNLDEIFDKVSLIKEENNKQLQEV